MVSRGNVHHLDLLHICRLVVFAIVLLFSLCELGLCANNIRTTKQGVFIDEGQEVLLLSPFYFTFAAFGVATSALTLLFMVPIIIVDLLRKDAFTSMIFVELAWTGVLWILWLATAGDATAAGIFHECIFEDENLSTICHQYAAIQGLAFFNWILLFGWWIVLLVLALQMRKKTQNRNIWRQSVADTNFTVAGAGFRQSLALRRMSTAPKETAMTEHASGQQTGEIHPSDPFNTHATAA